MKKALAIIYKDIRALQMKSLFLSYALAALFFWSVWFGLGGLNSNSLLQSFPIAVRNEDNTLISKNIVYQLSKMEIFSEVYHVKEESDKDLIDEGYVGVITIPKDFFYKVYTFDNEPIGIALSSSNSIQAMFLQEIIVSAMDIITSNQVARLGEHTYLYGENIDMDAVYEEASRDILGDLLKRNGIYEKEDEIFSIEHILVYRLVSLGIGILALFFTLNTVKSLLKDENIYVYGRMFVSRKERFLISLWHILYTYLLLLPLIIALDRLLLHTPYIYILSVLMISIFYAGYVFLKIWVRDERLYNRISNLVLIFLIFTSGQIWNINLFGDFYQSMIRCNPIYVMNLSLLTGEFSYMYAVLAGAGILYTIYYIMGNDAYEIWSHIDTKPGNIRRYPDVYIGRVLSLSVTKAFLIIGKWQGIFWSIVIGILLAMGFSDMRVPKNEQITLGVVDYDTTGRAEKLISDLDMDILVMEEALADRYILENKIEGKLILTKDGKLKLTTAPLSKTKEAIKEWISAKASVYQVQERVLLDIEAKRGSALSQEETEAFQEVVSEMAKQVKKVYAIRYFDKEVKESYFMPDIFRFILYIILLVLLSGIYVIADERARDVEARLTVLGGKGLAFWSDGYAMIVVGMGVGAALLYFGGIFDASRFAEMCLFTVSISLILKLLSQFAIFKNGAEVFYPIASLILAFALRCFIDIRL